tara:strand:- start:68 stop:463 length:396 start_codon:yes stop_codon:yes gene_type:complete
MASSVVSDNFETSSGAIPNMGGADVTTRLCSAWVNFDGTGTVAIRDSYNVSSITDGGVGGYTVNFTNALANTNYALVGGASRGATDYAGLQFQLGNVTITAKATTSCGVHCYNDAQASSDNHDVNVIILGG